MHSEGPVRLLRTSGGHYRRDLRSSMAYCEAYDGHNVLQRDWNQTHFLFQHAERETSLILAWFSSGYWAAPESGLSISLLGFDPPQLRHELRGSHALHERHNRGRY